jgi:hypothetical protein
MASRISWPPSDISDEQAMTQPEREPMGIYWYQFRPGAKGNVEWIRHIVDYGGRAGGGLQMVVRDIDGDGDRDIVTAGKTGLFLSESLLRPAKKP